MSREEAIRQLDGADAMLMNRDFKKFNQAVIMAINALREQEERSKGCEFCKEDKDGFRQMVCSFSLSNPFHKGEYYLNCGKAKPIRIYDCPMCGRKLEVEE